MRWPQWRWLEQMRALLLGRAGVPSKPIERREIFDEMVDQLETMPTPRLCQRCRNTRPSCRCPQGFAVLPVDDAHPFGEFDLEGDSHPTISGKGGKRERTSDKPPGRMPPKERGR